MRQLSELVSQVKDEQGYIVVRERTHRNTAESTNARVKWWSIFQILVLSINGGFQVWWLKRFFEVSRCASYSSTDPLTRMIGQACCVSIILRSEISHGQHCTIGVSARVKTSGIEMTRCTRILWSAWATRVAGTQVHLAKVADIPDPKRSSKLDMSSALA